MAIGPKPLLPLDEDPTPVMPSAPPAEGYTPAAGLAGVGSSITSATGSEPVLSYSLLTSMLRMPTASVNKALIARGQAPIAAPRPQLNRIFIKPSADVGAVAETYLHRPLVEVIPSYKKIKKTHKHIDSLLHAVKAQANNASFTLNPSEPLAEDHCVATLARAIVTHVVKNATASLASDKTTNDAFIAKVLKDLDEEIAQLHHKDISPEKRALIEVALRRQCVEKLLGALKDRLRPTSATGQAAFTPDIISIAEQLYIFATRGGAFKPCFDLSSAVMNLATPEMETFKRAFQGRFFAGVAHTVKADLSRLADDYRVYLQRTLIPGCTDPRSALFVERFIGESILRAENTLEPLLIGNALRSRDLARFAADLRKLDAVGSRCANISVPRAVRKYFTLMPFPAEKTLGKKLELCNRLLALYEQPEKLRVAQELLAVVHELELPAYTEAAKSQTLPPTWKSDLQAILECFTRSGRSADHRTDEAGELVALAPMDARELAPAIQGATELEIINQRLLRPFIDSVLQRMDKEVATKAKALSTPSNPRVLSIQARVPIQLSVIPGAVAAVEKNTQEADRASAKAFTEEFLHNACAETLRALSNFDAHREAFDRTGYIPLEVYGDAAALYNLATDNGRLLMRRHPLKDAIEQLLGKDSKIADDIAAIEREETETSLTGEIRALQAKKKQTLLWAREMLRSEGTAFMLPPMSILPERPVAAPAVAVAAAAPAAAAAAAARSAPDVMREDINGTEDISFEATRTDWFDHLRTKEKVCVLCNLYMKRMGPEGSIERGAKEHFTSRGIVDLSRESRAELLAIEKDLKGEEIKTIAQRLLIEYALRTSTFPESARATFTKMSENGIGSDAVFLREVYNQAVREADGYEISEGDPRWAESHWFTDSFTFSGGDAVQQLHNRRRVIQALERFILKPQV